MYRTCAVEGCCVSWDNIIIHHLKYFTRHRGPTDIDNLLPLCTKHHHCAHEGGWQLTLATDRTLTITLPNRTTMCHSPPRTLAA
jgi:predicted restriction endonuclease